MITILYSLTGSWLRNFRMISCLIAFSSLVALGTSSSLVLYSFPTLFCTFLPKCGCYQINTYLLQDSEWVNYKLSFSKEYATEAEESKRFDIWAANLDMVETHNQEATEGVHSYTMAVNQFSDLTYEEFEKTMLGYQDDEALEAVEYFKVSLSYG